MGAPRNAALRFERAQLAACEVDRINAAADRVASGKAAQLTNGAELALVQILANSGERLLRPISWREVRS